DNAAHEDKMRCGAPDSVIQSECHLGESRDDRPDRGEQEAHGSAIGPRREEASRANLKPSRRRGVRTYPVVGEVSHATGSSGNEEGDETVPAGWSIRPRARACCDAARRAILT